eukprot:RCo052952
MSLGRKSANEVVPLPAHIDVAPLCSAPSVSEGALEGQASALMIASAAPPELTLSPKPKERRADALSESVFTTGSGDFSGSRCVSCRRVRRHCCRIGAILCWMIPAMLVTCSVAVAVLIYNAGYSSVDTLATTLMSNVVDDVGSKIASEAASSI